MKKNRKKTVEAIRCVWSSLESHLRFCEDMKPKERELCGNEQFHIKTIRGYAETIKTLTELL